MVGCYIQKSLIINQSFNCDYVNLSTSTQLNEIGKHGIKKLFALINIQIRVLKLLLTTRYDLCYMTLTATTPGFYKDLLVIMILKMFKIKTVFHFHNKGIESCAEKSLNRRLFDFVFKNAKCILLSQHLYWDVRRFVKIHNVFFLANGVPPALASVPQIKYTNEVDGTAPVRLLFLSNMMIEKGVFVLLEACTLLKNTNPNFECHFVGPWSDVSEIKFNEFVMANSLDNHVFFHGQQYNENKRRFFDLCDIFVSPTNNDCFPLVILEAMQHALPVISTYEGGIPDMIVDRKTGFLFKKKDVCTLASKIKELMLDKKSRMEMGAQGRLRYEELFTMEKFENGLKDVLSEIINDGHKSNER